MFSKIILNSSWYYFLLSILLSAAFSFWLYFKNKKNKEVPAPVLYALFGLRFLSVFIIVLFLLNVLLKRIITEKENPVILIALDNSASLISANDSAYVKDQFLKDLQKFKTSTGEKYLVKTILFGSTCESSDKTPDFTDKETDLSNLFRTLDINYSNQNIGALVLISDGIYNKGSNPLYLSEKQNYPVYTLAMGDTSEFRDLAILKINHNQLSYSGNNFPVEVVIQAKKYAGEKVKVSVYEEGIQKAQESIQITSANFLSTVNFTLNAGKTGLSKYTAKIELLEGEKNKLNNTQSFVMEVIDSKEKILLVATSPHPDLSSIKEALSNSSNYELDFSFGKDPVKTIKAYNLVVFHGYTSAQSSLLNECKTNQVPYWIINPAVSENLPGIKISGSGNRYNDVEPVPVISFGLFNMSAEFKKFAGELPAVKSFFGNYTLNNGIQSLLTQRIGSVETENPILYFSETGTVKNAVFIGDGLWRWRLRDYAEHKNTDLFNELVSKSVQYLTVKADKSLFRVQGPKIIEENKAIEFNAEVYNKSYESITDPDVSMVIRNSENKKYTYTFGKANKAYNLKVGLLPIGEYVYEAEVKINNDLYKKQGSFVVKELVAEKINTVANHQLLYQLSKKSNGKLYYSHQLKDLEDALLKNETIKPISYSKKSTTPLIDYIWLFWIILILMVAEWFFRKRYLSI